MAGVETTNSPAVTEAATNEVHQQNPARIRYKVECEDQYGPNFDCKQDDKPFDLQVTTGPTDVDETMPIFEIITTLKVASKRPKYADYMLMMKAEGPEAPEEDEEESKEAEKAKPKPTLEGKRIVDVGQTRMVVHSPLLLDAIREVVEYYPSQNLTGDTITVHEPYCALVHYITELRNLSNTLALERTPAGSDEEKTDADVQYEHLQVLLDFLDPHVEKTVLPARRRLAKDVATVTFDDLWYLMRPGSLAYAMYEDTWLGVVIKESEFVTENDGNGELRKWNVKGWLLDHSWHSPSIGTAEVTIEVPYFEGEKVVTALPIHPREYFDRTDGGERREKFRRRGEKMCDIIWHGHAYLAYDGEFMDEKKRPYKGALIAETTMASGESMPDNKWGLTWDHSLEQGAVSAKKSACPQPIALHAENHARSLLSDEHLFLLCPVMAGFALGEKEWVPVNVDFMRDMAPPEYVLDANIGEENSQIIKALSHRQLKSKATWSADFIKNKGAGVVVLLHGPPGVGKTYTVETTAIHTRRPMLSLTIGDLGTNEESIESEIAKWFDLAHRWRSILLIDEADIFLERRKHTDLARNGVVTAFLRRMEYFGGLLFLTTNRVEHIDDAFMSRVHVVIGFEKLDVDKRRSIWQSFFQKLAREREGQIRVSADAEAYVLDGEMAEMEWNGREIRNAFQTAIAIAEYQAFEDPEQSEGDEIVVEAEHFRRVMAMSKKFRDYVDSVRKDNDSEWSDV
ncbi:hypothetical protein SLS56_011913 [Neofusicoccum ribis]|uniref:AAA+ ATPase domain-containing protein n=1 Tax=Neofusicoccum ribis TaxID=45134 RepID=A0ABR3SAB2_9PEZI